MDAIPEIIAPHSPWEALPDGEYAIVELFGHTTLVGRIEEIERYGAKLMAMRPLFSGTLLEPVYHGGAAIYRLTPCSRQIAWENQPKQSYQLPPAIKAVVPQALLVSASAQMSFDDRFDNEENTDVSEN